MKKSLQTIEWEPRNCEVGAMRRVTYATHLNTCTNNNACKKIGSNNTWYSHHQALNAGQACKEHEDKIGIVVKSWMQMHHEVDSSPRDKGNQEKEG